VVGLQQYALVETNVGKSEGRGKEAVMMALPPSFCLLVSLGLLLATPQEKDTRFLKNSSHPLDAFVLRS